MRSCAKRDVLLFFLAMGSAAGGEEIARQDGGARAKGDDLAFWLEDMAVYHHFSRDEVALATGLSREEVDRQLEERQLASGPKSRPPARSRDGSLLVLPYPGGRHPRIGFLEGAVNPWRETKASIFLPWENAGYVVVDLPEALWSNLGLSFLAHTHIATVWDKQGIKLERSDWTRKEGGILENRYVLPNGLEIEAGIFPRRDAVDMRLALKNGTKERLTGLRAQICLLLKGAEGFQAQTNDNKVISGRAIAVKSRDGKHWIVTVWQNAKPWGNPPCPCMHSDPVFSDLEPGAATAVHGRLFFFEGDDIAPEIDRRAREGTLEPLSVAPPEAQLLSVKRIWSEAPHNAFTSLVRFKETWWCALREGSAHVSGDGAIRVISSTDGDSWTSAALIQSPTGDLRDPKITATPDGRLLLSCASALHPPSPQKHQSLVWTSSDGRAWGEPVQVGDPDVWLWSITWHRGNAYGIGYSTAGPPFIRLYRAGGNLQFEKLADKLFDHGSPNESSLVFLEDDTAMCLLRRDEPEPSGQLGSARPPYTQWSWKDLGVQFGGPKMIQLPDARLIAAVRLYRDRVRTSLCWVDREKGSLSELVALPSGGDTSYAGVVYHEGLLWVSYYSSHEGKASIYLAKVKLR